MQITANFPFYAATGNQSSAVVYFEIAPGRSLGRHTDSAEEIVLVLSGVVEASLGEEAAQSVYVDELVAKDTMADYFAVMEAMKHDDEDDRWASIDEDRERLAQPKLAARA